MCDSAAGMPRVDVPSKNRVAKRVDLAVAMRIVRMLALIRHAPILIMEL